MPARLVLVQFDELNRRLQKMNPGVNTVIVSKALKESMLRILRNAAGDQIIRGGKGRPHPSRLTSRTGRLRRSLGPSVGLDESGLPFRIEGGSHLVYAAVHEAGGTHHPRRPFLEPALAEEEQHIPGSFRKHWAQSGELQ